jgi:2-keto-4-pentenoate hydratase
MVDAAQELARRMLADYDARTPGRLFAESLALTTLQAYDLQEEIARLREERGENVIGYKVGCTSRAIQQQLGIHEPIYGRIFDTGQVASGTQLSHARYANLAVEGELAIRLATDLTEASLASDECGDMIASIFPVIELHHYVLRSPLPCCQELIASNGMHAGFVSAEQPRFQPLVSAHRLTLRINDETCDACDHPWTMAGPMASLRWLATRLGGSNVRLTRGQVILTGSPLPLRPVGPGSRVVVEAPPLGSCCVEIGP